MFQYLMIQAAIELILLVACIGVFYYRRDILIPLFRSALKRFLWISDHEQRLNHCEDKSRLHAKRLNRHLRRLNVLEGKPARKEVAEKDLHENCTECSCCYEDDDWYDEDGFDN